MKLARTAASHNRCMTVPHSGPTSATDKGLQGVKQSRQQTMRAESAQALKALRGRIAADARRHNLKVWGVELLLTMSTAAITALAPGAWPSLLALLFPLAWFKPAGRPLTLREYYSLPHARSSNGHRRCVYCGHSTIERAPGLLGPALHKGAVLHRCAHCAMPLYQSI